MQVDRRLGDKPFPVGGIMLAWLAVSAVMLLAGLQRMLAGQFPDPDDVLRLVQVRDLTAGQAWFDTTQYRINPPDGTLMHWSRIVDAPLVALIALLTPLFGIAIAETAAMIVVPLVLLCLTMFAIGRVAWRLFGARVAVFACLACGFLPALLLQFQPMRIDHHGWQALIVAVALWGISWRNARHGGAIVGLSLAVGLSISIEVLPMAAAFAGVLFLRWWRDHHLRWWLVSFMQALSIALVVVFAGTRGFANLGQFCDAISPAHLGFFLIAAFGTSLIAARAQLRGIGLVLAFAVTGLAALAFFALSSPGCVTTPFAKLSPLVEDYWYRNVLDGQPLWKRDADVFFAAMVQMMAAVAMTVQLLMRSRDWLRRWWTEYLLLLLAAVVLSLLVSRSLAMASVIAAIPIGLLAATLLDWLRAARSLPSKAGGILSIMLLLAPTAPFMLADALAKPPAEPKQTAPSVAQSRCDINAQAERLDAVPRGVILAPLDIGPAILLKSRHSVVATGHHRAEAAMADVIRSFTFRPAMARSLIEAHRVSYIVLCTDMIEPRIYATRAPSGLAADLLDRNVPNWLEKVELGGSDEFVVYRVRRQAALKSSATPLMQ